MQIPQQLPQFKSSNALLVAMGSHHGIMYRASNGTLEKLDELRIDTPQYSDNEGMFKRGGGENFSYGSVLEPKKEKAQREFSVEMASKIHDFIKGGDIQEIYVYAPAETTSYIDSDWNTEVKKLISDRFEGNYVAKTPINLIEMIQEKLDSQNFKEPTGEAKRILSKF